jgi:hypothetical protein
MVDCLYASVLDAGADQSVIVAVVSNDDIRNAEWLRLFGDVTQDVSDEALQLVRDWVENPD